MYYCYNIPPPIKKICNGIQWLVMKSSCYASVTNCYQIQIVKILLKQDVNPTRGCTVHYIACRVYTYHDEGVYVQYIVH